jgi:hypothetical protein
VCVRPRGVGGINVPFLIGLNLVLIPTEARGLLWLRLYSPIT